MPDALTLRGLTIGIGKRTLVRDVDLSIARGEFVAVVGANGAGKTTLLRTMAGALRPLEGTIEVEGIPLATLAHRERARRVALVETDEVPADRLLVREAVAAARYAYHRWWEWEPRPDDEDAVADALARTGLADLAERSVSTLSSGERARLWIAVALAGRAPVVLLDEPTSHLDIRYAYEVLSLVRGLTDEGRAVVAVLHDLDDAAEFADRVVLIGEATVLATGPPAVALSPRVLARAYGFPIDVVTGPDGVRFHRPRARRTGGNLTHS